MADLRTALHGAGFASERKLREANAADWLKRDQESARQRKIEGEIEKRKEILRNSNSPDQFRREARKLLLQHPTFVQEVLQIAYARGMQKKKDKGGGRLIANLLQIRESIGRGRNSDEAYRAFVDKILTKN